MPTAPGVCATHFTAGYTLYNCVCDKIKKIPFPIMVKCLNIGKNKTDISVDH